MNINDAIKTMDTYQITELLNKSPRVQFPSNGFFQPRINWEKHGYLGSIKVGDLNQIFRHYEEELKDLNDLNGKSLDKYQQVLDKKLTNILHGIWRIVVIRRKVDDLWRNYSYSEKIEIFAGCFSRIQLLVKDRLDKSFITFVDKLMTLSKKLKNPGSKIAGLDLLKSNHYNKAMFLGYALRDISVSLFKISYYGHLYCSTISDKIFGEKVEYAAPKPPKPKTHYFRGQFIYNESKKTYSFESNFDPRSSYIFRDKPKPEISPYAAMGLNKDASASEIKKKYRKLALRYHPDKNIDPKAKGIFQKINNAYEILSDKKKRREYDMSY